MRFSLLIIMMLSFKLHANVLELGVIDSRKSLLDQRFTQTTSEEERLRSLSVFIENKNSILVSSLAPRQVVKMKESMEIDKEWFELLEVSHD